MVHPAVKSTYMLPIFYSTCRTISLAQSGKDFCMKQMKYTSGRIPESKAVFPGWIQSRQTVELCSHLIQQESKEGPQDWRKSQESFLSVRYFEHPLVTSIKLIWCCKTRHSYNQKPINVDSMLWCCKWCSHKQKNYPLKPLDFSVGKINK